MEHRKLGSLDVSLVGLGTNNFGMRCDEEQSAAVVRAALDAGVTFFDTADGYGGTKSEGYLGRALAGVRDEVVIATKFGPPIGGEGTGGGSARWVRQAVEDSLRRLGTDRIDLYQQHFPDTAVPIEETLGALNELVEAGKVREIGNSNYSAEQIRQADAAARAHGWARFVSAQNELNLLRRQPLVEVVPACEQAGLGFLPYFPLASGLLTGKYRRGQDPPADSRLALMPEDRRAQAFTDENFDLVEGLTAFAADHGHSLLDLAFAWLAGQPTIASVIAGATRPEQVRANAAAAAWTLGPSDLSEVQAVIDRNRS
ncbi:MAG TPA: aldo/keto reductase [Acidimicrobiales bacterium]